LKSAYEPAYSMKGLKPALMSVRDLIVRKWNGTYS
jgi:hypothetical protein